MVSYIVLEQNALRETKFVIVYLELLQRADSGVETVLRQAAGQEVDPCLLWSLSVHLFRIYIKVLW